MLPDIKICIVFNGGAAGDFLTSLIYQQLVNSNHFLTVDHNGTNTNQVSHDFKNCCSEFYRTNFDPVVFSSLDPTIKVVNTHFCHNELLELFPNCNFYYIDDSDYERIVVDNFIKKRIDGKLKLSSWFESEFKSTKIPVNIKKKIQLSDEQIKSLMISDYKKNATLWKSLGLTKLNYGDIIDVNKCRDMLKSIVRENFNEDVFLTSYEQWANKQ